MRRKIMQKLIEWKSRGEKRMPLILHGARQVGKTYIINEFGRVNYQDVIYVNFEINLNIARDFDTNITPEYLLNSLEAHFNRKIIPGETLIFFDEIQSCERALTSLKYFCENAPEYHVIAAGSLLGVAVNREKYSFPVGKADLLTLYPLDFEEFLWALEMDKLLEEIKQCYKNNTSISELLHQTALDLYKNYLIVGGMPAAVSAYLRERRLIDAGEVQDRILNAYIADMAKYASTSETAKIMAAFNSIPAQLAKDNRKFQYKVVQQGGTASIFGASIDWLCAAGVVVKCNKIEHAFMPPAVYQNFASFKLYMGDTGLLTLKSGISTHNILNSIEVNNTFVGAIAENYTAVSLQTNGYILYYWESGSQAEIDFVIQNDDKIIPIEVKAGTHTRSRSLPVFKAQYAPPYAIRVSARNFGYENGIKSVPLYAVFCI